MRAARSPTRPRRPCSNCAAEHDLTADDVVSVDAYVHDYVKTTTGLAEPRTGLEGKFSIYHVLAVALADGAALLDQFTDERVADPALARLRERVHVNTDAEQHKDSARVVLTLRDGRTLERHVAHNLGTPDNPMTDGQLEDKLARPGHRRSWAAPGRNRSRRRAGALLDLPDVRAVARADRSLTI